jgi:hypothetical protein
MEFRIQHSGTRMSDVVAANCPLTPTTLSTWNWRGTRAKPATIGQIKKDKPQMSWKKVSRVAKVQKSEVRIQKLGA